MHFFASVQLWSCHVLEVKFKFFFFVFSATFTRPLVSEGPSVWRRMYNYLLEYKYSIGIPFWSNFAVKYIYLLTFSLLDNVSN